MYIKMYIRTTLVAWRFGLPPRDQMDISGPFSPIMPDIP